MLNMFKAVIIAAISATALTAQVSTVYAMGSDRDPTMTNLFEANAPQQRFVVSQNKVFTIANTGANTASAVNTLFLAQR